KYPTTFWQSRTDLVGKFKMPTPIAVTVSDAVKATGMSRTSIYEALKRGDLSARKAGRRTLISFADLETYLASLPNYQAGA
ncbi:helix-turn-helix domain-containing protein, partial [Niveispirillum fermenti]|uniref:helix-turn-helix domain-containing protein n=1 Tax=Niveispirillum fermenti TaxID=1233113 RepID=UPI003A83BB79